MAELVELYSKGIKTKLANYWAAWLPGTRFDIGDIGILNGHLFEKVGTLEELSFKYYAESTVSIRPTASVNRFSTVMDCCHERRDWSGSSSSGPRGDCACGKFVPGERFGT